MRFSVIIRSHLGPYPGAASDRENKFIIALQSVLNQVITPEIIVVSDGCEITNRIIEGDERFKKVKLVKIPKQDLHSGKIAQAGFDAATGEYICFLDTDDFFGPEHLFIVDYLLTQHGNPDFGYYDTIKFNPIDPQKQIEEQYKQEILHCEIAQNHIGNGNIVFKRSLGVRYDDIECSTDLPGIGPVQNYGHDTIFAFRLKAAAKTIKKLYGMLKSDRKLIQSDSINQTVPLFPQYYNCHIPGDFDH